MKNKYRFEVVRQDFAEPLQTALKDLRHYLQHYQFVWFYFEKG